MVEKRAIGKMLDEDDPAAVSDWARTMCRDITLTEAAEALSVEPSKSAVIEVLVGSLPPDTREVARKICESELSDS